nr:MAG TPA: hypothetical protein [Caudoviricetes sp.]
MANTLYSFVYWIGKRILLSALPPLLPPWVRI